MKIFFSKKLERRFLRRLHDHLEYNYVVIIILILLFGLFVFSIINLFMIFRLRQEWQGVQTGIISSASTATQPAISYYNEPSDVVTVSAPVDVQVVTSTNEVIINQAEILTETKTAIVPDVPNIPNTIPPVPVLVPAPTPVITPIPTPTPVPTVPIVDRSNWKYNVFGDGFSNSYYVDMAKTNFRYDDTATSFSFKPLYEKRDNGACSQEYCSFSEKEKMDGGANVINQKYCLIKNSQSCLAWSGEELKYNDVKVETFSSIFSGLKPERVSIYPLSNYWLVGVVWTENGQEIGRAWRYDGQTLSALDPENRVPFITRQGYSGSNIYFGGDDSNYIVLYSGYDISGYQIANNTLWNITDFFNTRLADGGFAPSIIKHQQGKETVWYICSLTTGKPKLIKMWQNGSKVIRGLMSLSSEVFVDGYSSALCREGSDGNLEIATVKKSGEGNSYNKWSLIDKGFDESHDYQAISINLSSSRGRMKMANFNSLGLCGADFCGNSALGDNLNFTISNNAANFQVPVFGQEYLFNTSGSNLFWKLKASSDSNKSYYSPWFGAVNSVYYAWIE